MAIQFELYKTPRPKDEGDKEVYHARVVNFQHIDTDYLAKEIQIVCVNVLEVDYTCVIHFFVFLIFGTGSLVQFKLYCHY